MSDKPRCATCRHWTPDSQTANLLGDCDCPKIIKVGHVWAEGDIPHDGAIVESDYERFPTMAGFGCIHHEPREATDAA